MGHDFGLDWHHLWSPSGNGPAEYEEVDRVLVGQPPWICGAGNLQLHAGWTEWRDVRHAGSRNFDGWTVHAGGHSARTATHLRDQRIRRIGFAHAGLCGVLPGDRAGVGGSAASERIHWRISSVERRV